MATAYPDQVTSAYQDNPAYVNDDTASSGGESLTSCDESVTSELSDVINKNTDIDDVIIALEQERRKRKRTKRVSYKEDEKLQTPFRAKVIAVIIGLLCSLGFGYAAYSEASKFCFC